MINVSIKGKKLFDWEGSAEEAAKLDEGMRELASDNGVTPEQLQHSVVASVLKHGRFVSQSRGEMPILTWMLLSGPTRHPDHPGIYRDYIEAWEFDFDICGVYDPKRMKVSISVNARMQDGEQWESLN